MRALSFVLAQKPTNIEADRSVQGRTAMAREPSSSSDITEQELLRRKDFLEFSEDDIANLAGINDVARRYADAVIEDFYRRLLTFEETRTFFRDPQVLQRVKSVQQEYFLRLTQGKYDLAYAQNRQSRRNKLEPGASGPRREAEMPSDLKLKTRCRGSAR
jgi:Protoglobin